MRQRSDTNHSFPDLVSKSNLKNLSPELIGIALKADSPTSTENIALNRNKFTENEIRCAQALARIKKYYTEKLLELEEVRGVFDALPEIVKSELLVQLDEIRKNRTAQEATREKER
jgi:hypothetical protein